jgi:hypothetical protein
MKFLVFEFLLHTPLANTFPAQAPERVSLALLIAHTHIAVMGHALFPFLHRNNRKRVIVKRFIPAEPRELDFVLALPRYSRFARMVEHGVERVDLLHK